MPYYYIELFFPSEVSAGHCYNSVKKVTEYNDFEFYYNNKCNFYCTFPDVDMYDDDEREIEHHLIEQAISQKIRDIYKLFDYLITDYQPYICYVSAHDNKYASFTFSGGEENELAFNCLREGNPAGFVNLLKWDISAWLAVIKKELAMKEINRPLLKKIKVTLKDTPGEWMDFICNAGNLLRGKSADKSYAEREIQRTLFKWKGNKVPFTVMEGLTERGYEVRNHGDYMIFTSHASLPSHWKDYIKYIEL